MGGGSQQQLPQPVLQLHDVQKQSGRKELLRQGGQNLLQRTRYAAINVQEESRGSKFLCEGGQTLLQEPRQDVNSRPGSVKISAGSMDLVDLCPDGCDICHPCNKPPKTM